MQLHTVGEDETLLDIARLYGLGFNEIQLLHPRTDPWIPEPGGDLAIPTKWVLPATRHQGIVINLPEMRLYRFFPKINAVKDIPGRDRRPGQQDTGRDRLGRGPKCRPNLGCPGVPQGEV